MASGYRKLDQHTAGFLAVPLSVPSKCSVQRVKPTGETQPSAKAWRSNLDCGFASSSCLATMESSVRCFLDLNDFSRFEISISWNGSSVRDQRAVGHHVGSLVDASDSTCISWLYVQGSEWRMTRVSNVFRGSSYLWASHQHAIQEHFRKVCGQAASRMGAQ